MHIMGLFLQWQCYGTDNRNVLENFAIELKLFSQLKNGRWPGVLKLLL